MESNSELLAVKTLLFKKADVEEQLKGAIEQET
jgi:hypothetical protein